MSALTCGPAAITADPNAFFARYRRFIWKVAANRLAYATAGDRAIDAGDITQEASLRAFCRLGDFDPARGPVTTWLALVTRQTIWLTRHERTAAKRKHHRSARTGASVPDPRPAPTAATDTADVWAALARFLTDTEARALALRYGEGLGLEEIGRHLGFGWSRASKVINEALEKLHRSRFELLHVLGVD